MISTLNPKLSGAMSIISVMVLIYTYMHNVFSLFGFFIGILVTFPLTVGMWQVIENNWDSLYKKFYIKKFYSRNKELLYRSWKLTWWIVPWSTIVYFVLSIALLKAFYDLNVMFAFEFGSLFTIFSITYHKSPKFYSSIQKLQAR